MWVWWGLDLLRWGTMGDGVKAMEVEVVGDEEVEDMSSFFFYGK